jgi:stage III sporulation protein SpoIIIAA
LEEAQRAVGEFGGDNRAGIEGTLHRISAIRSRKGMVVGLTCRVGRAVTGHVDMVRDLLNYKESILFLGRYFVLFFQYCRILNASSNHLFVLNENTKTKLVCMCSMSTECMSILYRNMHMILGQSEFNTPFSLSFTNVFCHSVRPGVGKTTVMREIARVLADEFQKRVVC